MARRIGWLVALTVLILGLRGPVPAAHAQAAEPDPAKLAAATSDLVAASADAADTADAPVTQDDDGSQGWSLWSVIQWPLRLFSWAKSFGLFGGATIFSLLSIAVVGAMTLVGQGLIAAFNAIDSMTAPGQDQKRARIEAIIDRGTGAR
jgi:hypothetical protein